MLGGRGMGWEGAGERAVVGSSLQLCAINSPTQTLAPPTPPPTGKSPAPAQSTALHPDRTDRGRNGSEQPGRVS